MGWSGEVHDSRVTTAFLAAKREARLKRTHKLPEAQGNSGGWPLAAVAGLLLSAAAIRQDGNWRRATSKLQHFWRQLPLPGSQQVWQLYEAQLIYVCIVYHGDQHSTIMWPVSTACCPACTC